MEQNFPNRSHVFCVFCQMCNFIASNKGEPKPKVNPPKHLKHPKHPKHPKHRNRNFRNKTKPIFGQNRNV